MPGKTWRALVLALLFVGPFLVYLGFGFLWMLQRGWIWPTVAALVWTASGVLFAVLAARWTREPGDFLPYFDADKPETFSPKDRRAWDIVLAAAESADEVAIDRLTSIDLYVETAKQLAFDLARVYQPGVENPIERVPVLEALTALELAAEDLERLSRQIPGADLITPGHVKQAITAAGYLQKASDLYGYLIPIVNPASGLPRLVAQKLMVKPAWRDARQNVAKWFHQAFVCRLGIHLIELYSGRLSVGTERYRLLTRRSEIASDAERHVELRAAFAGSNLSGVERLPARLDAARSGAALSPSANRLADATRLAIPPYPAVTGPESSRDRANRARSVEAASRGDFLLLVIDDRAEGHDSDLAFLAEWSAWFDRHPEVERPPVFVLVAGTDALRLSALRSSLPDFVARVVPIDVDHPDASAVWEAAASRLHDIERVAVIRRLGEEASKPRAKRLVEQLGRGGRWALNRFLASRSERGDSGGPDQPGR